MERFIGSFGLVVHQRKVALLLRDDDASIPSPNTWCFIGGNADPDESPEQTFQRESVEEINANGSQLQRLEDFYFNQYNHAVFVMELSDQQFNALRLGSEGQRFDFFTFDQLISLPLSTTTTAYVAQHSQTIKEFIDN